MLSLGVGLAMYNAYSCNGGSVTIIKGKVAGDTSDFPLWTKYEGK
jgi:hypothetical protein